MNKAEKENKERRSNLLDRIVPIVIVLAIALLVLNNFMLFERGVKVAEAKAIMEEELRPAELQFVKITQDVCDFCFDVETIVGELKNQNIDITKEETFSSNSPEGREFITKYGIKELPTIIVSGEIDKSEQLTNYFESKGEIKDDKFIYTSQIPPYFDALSNQINTAFPTQVLSKALIELRNLIAVSALIVEGALSRKESRGLHYSLDYPEALPRAFDTVLTPKYLKELGEL